MLTLTPLANRKSRSSTYCVALLTRRNGSRCTNSASELTAVEFLGIQMHHNLNRVTLDLGVIDIKRSAVAIKSSPRTGSRTPYRRVSVIVNGYTNRMTEHTDLSIN